MSIKKKIVSTSLFSDVEQWRHPERSRRTIDLKYKYNHPKISKHDIAAKFVYLNMIKSFILPHHHPLILRFDDTA
jgi:hypothetical protein